MKKTSISVTDAARNFADCINRAHYQDITFILLKNGEPVARIVPDGKKSCTGQDLAKALSEVRLSKENRKAWLRDLRRGHKILKPPVNRWR
jgi:antitoxin (DNA-binding transcriptional repressor) of toxin-antitoxin stability system